MFQTQTKWKLGALLLAASLLMPAAAHAKDYEQSGWTAPESIVSRLKGGYKWTGTNGEVYLFRKDGQFEYRAPRDSAYSFSKDFGRFTVRPVNEDDKPYLNGEKWILQMKTTSSVRKPDKKGGESKVVQRIALNSSPIKLYSNRPNNDDRYDPYFSFAVKGRGRFTQVNAYGKYN